MDSIMNRRKFIKRSALASAGTMLIPGFLKAYEAAQMNSPINHHKKLIVIQLSGGNDGLNTVVPFRNDVYYELRPRLAVPKNKVLKLNDELGFNPVLSGLKSIYDQGWLSVVNNVGYPNPDRSHFRSMDIWQTASNADQYLTTGWLGRYLDAECANDCRTAHEVIEVDDTLSLATKGARIKGLALTNPHKLYKSTQNDGLKMLAKQKNAHHHDSNVSYLYKTLAETVSSAEYIHKKAKVYNSKANYPRNAFAQRLKTIASLVTSGIDTKVYYAEMTGFDTHVQQQRRQERLLKTYADAMKVFVDDLKQNNRLDEVLILTFSEFGRRVKQNASNGTDHGTANNLFVIGGKLQKAGVYNESPNLKDLDKGDLKYSIDFRSVYATLLDKHLKVNDQKILGKNFEKLKFV